MSLTGDPTTDAVVPAATRLIWAVREGNAVEVDAAMNEACTAAGGPGLEALVVVLAAMVPDDLSPSILLQWMADPTEYLHLREAGIGAFAAMNMVRVKPRAVA